MNEEAIKKTCLSEKYKLINKEIMLLKKRLKEIDGFL